MLNIIIVLLIVAKAKCSYFSVKTLILNYILSPIFFQFNYGKSYGILNANYITLHYTEIAMIMLVYNLITYLLIINTDILKKEKEMLNFKTNTSNLFAIICSIIAIIFSIIALPYLPFQNFDEVTRFGALLPGRAWNHLAIIALIFAYPELKDSNVVKIAYAFTIFWFLSHYERVDIVGLILLIAILLLVNKIDKISIKKIIIYSFIALCILIILLKIGEVRMNHGTHINIIEKIFLQNTASDIGYVFNSSIDYAMNNEKLLGKTYYTYLVEAIPMLETNERVELILQRMYNSPGGSYLFSEPIMNFGILGVFVFVLLECIIFSWILNKQNEFKFYIYCFFIATVFRSCWYGLNYLETGLLYFIPLMYFMKHIIQRNSK